MRTCIRICSMQDEHIHIYSSSQYAVVNSHKHNSRLHIGQTYACSMHHRVRRMWGCIWAGICISLI